MRLLKYLPDNISSIEKMLYLTYTDLIAFGKRFLPGDFMKSETPLFHYELADEINSDSTKPCAIIIARDSGKTTLIKCSIIHDFCFSKQFLQKCAEMKGFVLGEYWWNEMLNREPLFYGWTAKTQDDSIGNVRYIAKHLEQNYDIINIFGKLRGDIWNKEEITTIYGDKLISSSNLKSIRGKTEATIESGAIRFSRVFADDIENELNTKTQSARQDLRNTLFGAILPAIDQKPRCRLFFINTPQPLSIAQEFIEAYKKCKAEGTLDSYSWKIFVYPSTQPDMPGGVLWNSRLPRYVLNKIKERYESRGQLALYYQEYELEVASSDVAIWTRDHIKFHNGIFMHEGGNIRDGNGVNYLVINGEKIVVNTFLGCDPATDIATRSSSYSCIIAIAVDGLNRRYHLRTERHQNIPMSGLRGDNDELIGKKGVVDYYIEMYDEFHCLYGSIEDVSLNRSVFQDLMQRKMKLNKMYVIGNPQKPGGVDKLNRISSYLNPFYTQGMIYYREESYNLIEETINFGATMAHSDEIDAFYYANVSAYPPQGYIKRKSPEEANTEWYIKRKRAKSWKVM